MTVKAQRKTNAASVSYKVKPVKKPRSSASRTASRSNGKHSLSAFEHLHVGIVECSLDGKYLNVNEEFCRIIGYSKEELLQLATRDCTHEEDYILDMKLHQQLIDGKVPFYGLEKRLLRKDGQIVWIELTRSLVRDEAGKPLSTMAVAVDISEYKHVERVLRESAENLRLATEAARMFKWELDFQKQIYTFSDSFPRVLGFSAGLLPQNSVEEIHRLSPAEDVQAMSEAISAAIQNHTDLSSLQYRMINPEDGQTVWLEVNAKIVYDRLGQAQRMYGVAQNITEEKKAQEEIRTISRMSAENPNPVMRLTPDGRILYANAPSQDLLEVWRRQSAQTIPQELRKHVTQTFASGVKHEIEITQNGRTFACTLAPIREAGYVNLYATDITERKRVENALRESEERFRALFSQATAGIAQTDVDSRLIFVNPKLTEMLGYSESDLIGKTIWQLTDPEDLEENKRLFERMLAQGQSYQFEKRFIRKDGSTVWTSVSVSAIHDADGKVTGGVGVIVDITLRKQAEEALRAQESELQEIINRTPFMLTRCSRDLHYRFVSKAYARMIGRTPQEIAGKSILEIMGPQGLQTIRPYVEKVLQGEQVEYETEVSLAGIGVPSLHVIYSPDRDEQGQVIGWFASIIDVTERKQMEEALRIENERFMRFVNSNVVGILIGDPSGKVILANDYYLQTLGVSRQDFIEGKVDWKKFTPPEWLPADEKAIQELRERGVCEPYEKEYVRADGRRVPVYITDAMLPGPGEEIAAFVLDITERKHSEKALTEFARQQEALYRLSDQLHHTQSLEDVYQAALDAILSALQCDRASILLFDDTGVMRFVAWQGLSELYRQGTEGHSPWGPEERNPYPICVGEVAASDLSDSLKATIRQEGIASLAFIPLMLNGRLIGKFMVYFDDLHECNDNEIELGLMIARQLASGMERQQTEETLRVRARQQQAVARLGELAVRERDLQAVFDQAAVMVTETLKIEYCKILELRPDKQAFLLRAGVGWKPGLVGRLSISGNYESQAGYTLLSNTPVVVADLRAEQRFSSSPLLLEHGVVSGMSCIVHSGDAQPWGVLAAHTTRRTSFTEDDLNFLTAMANILGDAIQRQQADQALRQSEERYRTIVDTANEGIWYVDLTATTVYLNEPMANILGYTADEVIGRKVPEFCFDEDVPKARTRIASNYQGNFENFDFRFRRKDGSEVLVLASTSPVRDGAGKTIGALGMFADVTERKRAEEQLRESEERLRVTFDTAVVGFATLTPDARFVDVNDAFCRIVGYSREDLLQMNCAALTHPFYIESTNEHVRQLVEGRVPSFVLEKLYVRKDGTQIWVQNSVSIVRDLDGAPLHLIAICQDITERKQAEEQLRKSAEFDAFRVALTDAVRPLSEPQQILAEAMRVLGEKLQVDRVIYSEIEPDDETVLILDNYVRDGVARLTGRASLNDYGRSRELLHAGRSLIIEDAATSPDMDEKDRASFAAVGIRAGLAIPLIKNGRWAATLGVHHSQARTWTENEIKFMEETAERTWSAVERARAQEKLRASETLYRTIARSIPGGGVYVVDRDFRYMVAEGPVTEAFGLSRDELEGRTVWEAFPDERGARMQARLQRTFEGETVSFETRNEGRVFWTQQAPLRDSIGQAIIVTIDITERKLAEEALRQSEERFARFMQHLPGLAWIKDIEGRYVYANSAAEKVFSIPREKLYGKTDREVFPPQLAAEFKRNDEQALVNERGMQTIETLEQDDGVLHYSLVTKFPIPGPDGNPALIGGTAFDITERLQAEEELRRSEERYRTLFNLVPIAVYTCDANGLIQEYNHRAVEVWGREPKLDDPQETRYGGSYKLYYPDGRPMPREEHPMSRALRGEMLESSEAEMLVERPDGSRRHVIAHPLPLRDEHGQIVEAINCLYDITERKQAIEALYESEQRFKAILNQATAGIVRKNAEGRLIFVNEAYCNMLGYMEEELLGRNFWEFTYHEDEAQNKHLYDRMMDEGIPFKLEKRVVRRDGSIIWIDASVSPVMDAEGKPQSAVAVEVDITGRKQAEEELQQLNLQLESRVQKRTATIQAMNQSLREEIAERKRIEEALRISEATARASEEKLRTLFDLLPVGISFLDPEGEIIETNAALLKILGLSKEQLMDRVYKTRKYIRVDGTAMSPAEFAGVRALKENRTIYNVETGVTLENGEIVWTSVSAAPVDVADVGVVVVTVDITESKRAERALQESHGRLRILSQRLVEVQEDERRALARELHDRVGQTLAALNINLIIINSQLAPEAAQQIGARLNDSMKLVGETIALVRDVMTDLRPAVLDDYGLEAALEAHLTGFRGRYNLQVTLEKSAQPLPRLGPTIEMTFLRIAQEALMNIAKHAHAQHVALSLRQEEQSVCLSIQDDGTGIDSWQHASRPGSHGLTIMRERAEAFGGTLQVRSSPGQGTTVEVCIPFSKIETQNKTEEDKRL